MQGTAARWVLPHPAGRDEELHFAEVERVTQRKWGSQWCSGAAPEPSHFLSPLGSLQREPPKVITVGDRGVVQLQEPLPPPATVKSCLHIFKQNAEPPPTSLAAGLGARLEERPEALQGLMGSRGRCISQESRGDGVGGHGKGGHSDTAERPPRRA